jgi:hypothetical protein
MQMSVILCSHGLLDWFNKTIMYKVQDSSVLHDNAAHPFICES